MSSDNVQEKTIPQNYYEAKGYLWMKLMNSIKGPWQVYQQKCIANAAKLQADPKKNIDRYMTELIKDIESNKANALVIYGEYITKLYSSWALHALRNEGLPQITIDTAATYLSKSLEPQGTKAAKKTAVKGTKRRK